MTRAKPEHLRKKFYPCANGCGKRTDRTSTKEHADWCFQCRWAETSRLAYESGGRRGRPWTDAERTPEERAAVATGCPFCDAKPNEPCVLPSGLPYVHGQGGSRFRGIHEARKRRAGRLALTVVTH